MEYRSSLSVLGLPLVHVASGRIIEGGYRRGVATGWIAIGDIAIGIVFSCGAVAVGGISVGGLSVGVLSIGGLALGVAALGGLSVGVIAAGGAALAWYAAAGGLAVAHDYAIGGAAFAEHVVSPLSREFQLRSPIPQAAFHMEDAVWLAAIVVALLILARRIRRPRDGQE